MFLFAKSVLVCVIQSALFTYRKQYQLQQLPNLCSVKNYLEVEGVVGVRHQAVLIGALQLEAVGDPAVGRAVLAVAVEFGQAVTITKLLEVLVSAVHSASTQVLHYA